ncbi:hypothetical protein [Actinoplanes sp. NPDC049802]|uniref:hypothetical protein n=1 Tax=Actinoplanes sp. NPDC049802 TaxID=3154742 RepID=UPI0033DDEC46
MNVGAASLSAWNSYAAWNRLAEARSKLAADLMPTQSSPGVVTSSRAAVANAEHEVVRVEAARAAELARFQRSGRFIDITV